ncbi:hypothetical protein Tco_0071637 [Tanacetum coccineum]
MTRIVSTSSTGLSLTSGDRNDFILEEVMTLFSLMKMIPTSPKLMTSYYDLRGTFFFLKHFLNDDHHYPPPLKEIICLKNFEKYLVCEAIKYDKSSIDESSEVELKELPLILEYAFLEGIALGNSSTSRGLTRNFILNRFLWKRTTTAVFNTKGGVNPKDLRLSSKREVEKLLTRINVP